MKNSNYNRFYSQFKFFKTFLITCLNKGAGKEIEKVTIDFRNRGEIPRKLGLIPYVDILTFIILCKQLVSTNRTVFVQGNIIVLFLVKLVIRLRYDFKFNDSDYEIEIKDEFSKKWVSVSLVAINRRTVYSIDQTIGIVGLINFLNQNDINYTFIRYFEKMPKLYRAEGDWDILIEDSSYDILKCFLLSNPGTINIDVYSDVKLSDHEELYFPDNLNKMLLEDYRLNEFKARIPNPISYFVTYSYHLCFHKKIKSGLHYDHSKVWKFPTEIDTPKFLLNLAVEAGLDFGNNLHFKDIFEYLVVNKFIEIKNETIEIVNKDNWLRRAYEELKDGRISHHY